MIFERVRPRSQRVGRGRDGGGVTGREGSGEEGLEEESRRGEGSGGADWSRVGMEAFSRRCMRFEKKPDMRLEVRGW